MLVFGTGGTVLGNINRFDIREHHHFSYFGVCTADTRFGIGNACSLPVTRHCRKRQMYENLCLLESEGFNDCHSDPCRSLMISLAITALHPCLFGLYAILAAPSCTACLADV